MWNRRWYRIALVWVLILAGCGGAIILPDSAAKEKSRLKREIDAALPLGSTRSDVEKWLDARGFQFVALEDENGRISGLEVCLDREYFWDGNGRLTIWFSFDRKGGLTEHGTEWESFSF